MTKHRISQISSLAMFGLLLVAGFVTPAAQAAELHDTNSGYDCGWHTTESGGHFYGCCAWVTQGSPTGFGYYECTCIGYWECHHPPEERITSDGELSAEASVTDSVTDASVQLSGHLDIDTDSVDGVNLSGTCSVSVGESIHDCYVDV